LLEHVLDLELSAIHLLAGEYLKHR
jgi:hypothetical protein